MKKTCLLFPGQGSFNCERTRTLINNNNTAIDCFNTASEIIGKDITQPWLNDNCESFAGGIMEMTPLIFTAGYATYQLYIKEHADERLILCGHSLGEYTALANAGVFSFEDALRLVIKRAELAEKANGVMTVVRKTDSSFIEALCSQLRRDGSSIWPCCYNTKTQICVASDLHSMEVFEKRLVGTDNKLLRIKDNPPYHSPLMSDVISELREAIRACKIHEPSHPVISGVYAIPYEGAHQVEQYLLDQMVMPIRWTRVSEYISRQSCDRFVEMGGSEIISRMLKSNIGITAETY